MGADILKFLGEGARGPLGGQLDLPRNALTLRMSVTGRHILAAAPFAKERE